MPRAVLVPLCPSLSRKTWVWRKPRSIQLPGEPKQNRAGLLHHQTAEVGYGGGVCVTKLVSTREKVAGRVWKRMVPSQQTCRQRLPGAPAPRPLDGSAVPRQPPPAAPLPPALGFAGGFYRLPLPNPPAQNGWSAGMGGGEGSDPSLGGGSGRCCGV